MLPKLASIMLQKAGGSFWEGRKAAYLVEMKASREARGSGMVQFDGWAEDCFKAVGKGAGSQEEEELIEKEPRRGPFLACL